MALRAGSHAS